MPKRPLPRNAARLLDAEEVRGLVHAAQTGAVVLVPLDREPPAGPHVLELTAPELDSPVFVVAEPAGEPTAGMFPLRLAPIDDAHGLRLASLDVTPRSSRQPVIKLDSLDGPFRDSVALGVARLVTDSLDAEGAQTVRPPSPSQADDQLIGTTLGAGRYRVVRRIGTGGIGAVYEGVDGTSAHHVALKVLHSRNPNERHVEQFRKEAFAAGRLDHANLMRVFDFARDGDGRYFLVMELLEGIDLRRFITERRRLAVDDAISIATQICDGLHAAHSAGIIHRDVKPENVLVHELSDAVGIERYRVKVCDFGAARITGPTTQAATLTGVLRGTPEFMAPEQITGDAMDARTDVYAIGMVLYEMLTGRVPFVSARIVETLNMQLATKPARPSHHVPSIPPELDAIVLRALEKKPNARHESAALLADALRAFARA